MGRRPLDGGNADGRFCLVPLTEYMRHSNEERIIILQIESPEALENVEAIAAVPGFNGIMFGPGDFSHRIGKAGQLDAPEVVAARRRVGAACRKNGKFAMAAGLMAPLPELVAEGYGVFGIGADVAGLANYVTERLKVLNSQEEALAAAPSTGKTSPYK